MAIDTAKQKLGFQSEVNQLLDLMIHSLYSNQEIFLRELISNGVDAIDKLKFEALSDDALYEGDAELEITVDYSEKLKTLTVRDNGIGMSRDEVIENLGTIAKSGTKEFFGALTGDSQKDAHLIGQFGVGFYSSFIVADKVTVTSRRAGVSEDEAVRWESDGKGEFTVETIKRKKRGTEVVLHLHKEGKQFADGYQLRRIIKRYSDHVSCPILMPKQGDGATGYEVVNTATALWARNKKEIDDNEYKEFYKSLGHDFEDPLTWLHSKVEGKLEYTTLFYVPAKAPFDLWDREPKHGVKLYIQRVFIMDDVEQLLPRYLRFIRGIIDSNDLPLNVSREILQRNKAVDTIRSASVKKILGVFEGLAKGDGYAAFWRAFGRVIKEGIVEDPANQERIAKLLRFSSTRETDPDALVSLEDYVSRMGEDQKAIYYVIADSYSTAAKSPHLEVFRSRDIEVLLLHEPVDEWVVAHLHQFDDKPLKSITQGELDLAQDGAKDGAEKTTEGKSGSEHQGLLDRIKKQLDDKVKDVRISSRLTTSPVCLVSDENEMGANLQRILKAAGQDMPESKRILEVNPEHPILARLEDETDEARFSDWTSMLYEQAVLAEGGRLDDPAGFVSRINKMLVDMGGG